MRLPALILAVLFGTLVFAIDTPSSGRGKIGYGSSTAVISSVFQENVFRGFELGFQKILGRERAQNLLLVKQNNDKSIQGATLSATALVDAGVVAVIGFPVSHDALLAADVAKKNGLLAVFGAASHTALSEKGPLVYSTGASLDKLVTELCQFIQKMFPAKRGMVVVNRSSVFSVNQENQLKREPVPGLKLDIVQLNDSMALPEEELAKLKRGEYDYLYFTLYPDDLVVLMNQLQNAQVALPTVAFGGADPGILARFVHTQPFYIATGWVPGAPEMKELDAQMQKLYGMKGNFESVIGYNLGLVMGQTVKRVKGELTRESVIKAFKEDPCFTVIGKTQLCFGPNGGHATSRGLKFTRFTQVGLEKPAKK